MVMEWHTPLHAAFSVQDSILDFNQFHFLIDCTQNIAPSSFKPCKMNDFAIKLEFLHR